MTDRASVETLEPGAAAGGGPDERPGGAPAVWVGGAPLRLNGRPVEGRPVEVGGEAWYRIENVDRMDPFFVTVISAGELWLFASSTGALTAGRRSPEHALFPYETVDRIHDAQGRTGGLTLVLAARDDGGWALWEPFSERHAGLHRTRRSLARSPLGDRLRFEEVNDDLGLRVAQTWATSERYGLVRSVELRNTGGAAARVRVLDGVQNLMPYGVSRAMQERRSVLADAYKHSEVLPGSGVGVFALSALPVDRAEPSEALLATTVWAAGAEPDAVLLSADQVGRFRRGAALAPEARVRARRGAYLLHQTLALAPGERRTWDVVADIEQDAAAVVRLDAALAEPAALRADLHADVAAGTERLRVLTATADGAQVSADAMTAARHRMNVLYNVMRGGVFDDGYTVRRDELRAFLHAHNAPLAREHAAWVDALPAALSVQSLRAAADAATPQLRRLCAQVLPLHFSRRHGDPSRPWNEFAINVRHPDGRLRRGYEGNWRDIFQNWEALGHSFPGYLESMVAVFVNASTADGYNPYRITDAGIDWETIEPDDPWSYIGYWGDHQIVYLVRLLEALRAHAPDRLAALLGERRFSYANVPYRIKPYADLLADPHDTIVYDRDEEARVAERVAAVGADGRLLWDASGEVALVTLAEKLLVPVLVKLTQFVPDGGIWMNTQRPEWNDANNALVGYGLSVVTLCAVRRYLAVLDRLLADAPPLVLTEGVADLLAEVSAAFAAAPALAEGPVSDVERRRVLGALGEAGARHRARLYADGLAETVRTVPAAEVRALVARALPAADATLAGARRADGLVESYRLLRIGAGALGVDPLYPMLEGQVAALDAGVLAPDEALGVLGALRASAMYRPDQHSYTLYPDRDLPGFVAKNTLPADALDRAPLLRALLDAGDTSVVARDVRGGLHFHGTFRNRRDVEAALGRLSGPDGALGREVNPDERAAVLRVFEDLFEHHAYTGRSGTFFAYEGLGSIYWHMVSKLALATQETLFRADDAGADAATLARLADAYEDVRAGLGGSKPPEVYGAFPADAYSHTPAHAGAQQPGMTGQVKEDILCRWGELGVLVEGGRIVFRPLLLRAEEFTQSAAALRYVDASGTPQELAVPAGSLAFTYGAVPFVYRRADEPRVTVVYADGRAERTAGHALSPEVSAAIFARTGAVARVEVELPAPR